MKFNRAVRGVVDLVAVLLHALVVYDSLRHSVFPGQIQCCNQIHQIVQARAVPHNGTVALELRVKHFFGLNHADVLEVAGYNEQQRRRIAHSAGQVDVEVVILGHLFQHGRDRTGLVGFLHAVGHRDRHQLFRLHAKLFQELIPEILQRGHLIAGAICRRDGRLCPDRVAAQGHDLVRPGCRQTLCSAAGSTLSTPMAPAGPSSSGKTTFSHRLSIQLRASGFKPHAIGVDNYFVEREQTPVDENGEYNFEDLHAIDIKLFNDHMNALLRGEKVEIPQFNFLTGRKEYNGDYIQLGEEDILVIEGIHCLNDELSYALPVESKFKIYISALTQLNVDEHNRVATTDGRLIRRMARDYRTRGASAKRTLSMWESVRKGEEKNIFPFQEEADAMFNSAMAYELCILKPIVEPLLFSITEDDPEYQEAKRLLKFLAYFLPCQADNVPINSIMREFIGGGCFRV